jgi:hypothetical protein
MLLNVNHFSSIKRRKLARPSAMLMSTNKAKILKKKTKNTKTQIQANSISASLDLTREFVLTATNSDISLENARNPENSRSLSDQNPLPSSPSTKRLLP